MVGSWDRVSLWEGGWALGWSVFVGVGWAVGWSEFMGGWMGLEME